MRPGPSGSDHVAAAIVLAVAASIVLALLFHALVPGGIRS